MAPSLPGVQTGTERPPLRGGPAPPHPQIGYRHRRGRRSRLPVAPPRRSAVEALAERLDVLHQHYPRQVLRLGEPGIRAHISRRTWSEKTPFINNTSALGSKFRLLPVKSRLHLSATERGAEAGKVDGRELACAPGSVPNIRRAAPPTSIAEDDLGRTFLFAGGDGGGDEGRSVGCEPKENSSSRGSEGTGCDKSGEKRRSSPSSSSSADSLIPNSRSS